MEWEFTPEQVVKGEVAYGIAEFRRGLWQEVQLNFPQFGPAETERCFDVLYELCHWLATGRDFEQFEFAEGHTLFDLSFLRSAREHMAPNVQMLGAILQRMIMDGVEAGMPLEQAVAAAARRHDQAVSRGGQSLPAAPAD